MSVAVLGGAILLVTGLRGVVQSHARYRLGVYDSFGFLGSFVHVAGYIYVLAGAACALAAALLLVLRRSAGSGAAAAVLAGAGAVVAGVGIHADHYAFSKAYLLAAAVPAAAAVLAVLSLTRRAPATRR